MNIHGTLAFFWLFSVKIISASFARGRQLAE